MLSKLKIKPLYLVAGLVLLLGAAALVWWLVLAPDASAQSPSQDHEDGTVCEIGQFLTNLADEGSRRLLRLTLVLVVSDQRTAKELTAKSSLVKNEILALLRSKRLAEVEGGKGMLQLASDVVDRVNALLGRKAVFRAYFTDFIVQ